MAQIHREADRPARLRSAPRRSFRLAWALAGCACAGVLLVVLVAPDETQDLKAEAIAMQEAERELAEVLHLAGSKWVRAQEAAFGSE